MLLTQESLTAIQKRKHLEEAAAIRAKYRFELEQHEVSDRKYRNRLILGICLMATAAIFVGRDFASKATAETGARSGEVIAKSDLHVEVAKPEKRHDTGKIRSKAN